jgi:hypothetical protein
MGSSTDMPQLPASPAAHKRELAHRERMQLEQLDQKLDRALAMVRTEVGSNAPSTFDSDVEEVGVLLVEGKVRLPSYVRITVTTSIEEVRSKVFGTSEIFTHTADQLCAHQLQPMSIQAAIGVGLLVKLGGSWRWSEAAYKRLVPPDPRLV